MAMQTTFTPEPQSLERSHFYLPFLAGFYEKIAQPFAWTAFRVAIGGMLMIEGYPKIMAPMAQVGFVAVLVQRQARAGLVAVDQAGLGPEARITGGQCGSIGEFNECRRHRRPVPAAVRVDRIVAVATRIADPAEPAAIAHRHRHAVAAGRDQVAQRRHPHHFMQRRQQLRRPLAGEAAEQHRAGIECAPLRRRLEQVERPGLRRHRGR